MRLLFICVIIGMVMVMATDMMDIDTDYNNDDYRVPQWNEKDAPSLRSSYLLWHRSLSGHDQSYNSVAISARHPATASASAAKYGYDDTLPSPPQFASAGRTHQHSTHSHSFAESIDIKNNTQFQISTNETTTWVLTARHAYNKPVGSVNVFVVRQIGLFPQSATYECEITGYDATANKPVWTYRVAECRFATLDQSQHRRGLVSDDGSTLAIAVTSNSSLIMADDINYKGSDDSDVTVGAQHAQLHVIDAQSGKAKYVHRLSTMDVTHHGAPSVSGKGEYVTAVAGSRCDVYTSTGDLRTKNEINIHHESLVYLDPSGNYLVYHDHASNIQILRWEPTRDNYTHLATVPARDEKAVEWHPVDWEISHDEIYGPLLVITWTRGRTHRTQSKLTVYDLTNLKIVWNYHTSRSRQVETELVPSFHAPYIGVASWSNDDSSDPQLLLFHTRSNVPIWQHRTGGSLWTIQIVVASSVPHLPSTSTSTSTSAATPNPATDVIYLIAAGSSHHTHVPGVGQSYAYDLEFTQQ